MFQRFLLKWHKFPNSWLLSHSTCPTVPLLSFRAEKKRVLPQLAASAGCPLVPFSHLIHLFCNISLPPPAGLTHLPAPDRGVSFLKPAQLSASFGLPKLPSSFLLFSPFLSMCSLCHFHWVFFKFLLSHPPFSSATAGPIAPTIFPIFFHNFLGSQLGPHYTLQLYLSCFRFPSDFHHSSFPFSHCQSTPRVPWKYTWFFVTPSAQLSQFNPAQLSYSPKAFCGLFLSSLF